MAANEIQNVTSIILECICILLIMGCVSFFNVYCFLSLMLNYRNTLNQSKLHGPKYEILRFVLYTIILMLTMIVSLAIWVIALISLDLIKDWFEALLYAMSFFTSVGDFRTPMPSGWRLMPSIISVSGLFAFAGATAASIGMANALIRHLDKK
jgi:hypothetical protein